MIGPERWTEQYIRIPFVESGFDKSGCHCWGLVYLIYLQEKKVELPKYDIITSSQIRKMIAAKDYEIATGPWVQVIHPEPLDVAVMRGEDEHGRMTERHVGVFAGNNHIIHVEKGRDSQCDSMDNLLFRTRVTRIFRYVK